MDDHSRQKPPLAAMELPALEGTIYPPPWDRQVRGRKKRKLGEHFGLTNFGVNLTELGPGAASSLAHAHTLQDEFLFVWEGELLLCLGGKHYWLRAGDCIGLPKGTGCAHRLLNLSHAPARYLEIGDRTPGDIVYYPDAGLRACQDVNGRWRIETEA